MSYEWMRTKEQAWTLTRNPQPSNHGFKEIDDFLIFSKDVHPDASTVTSIIVDLILAQAQIEELDGKSARLASLYELPEDEESIRMSLAWACANALIASPSVETWKIIKSIAYNSWEIEHWIDPAMMAAAANINGAAAVLCSLAKNVFQQLDTGELSTNQERFETERSRSISHWDACDDKLIELWWGLRWDNSMSYQEDFALLRVWSRLSLPDFVLSLDEARRPSLVQSALVVTGAGPFNPMFETWTVFVQTSRPAFDLDGRWNGSVLTPLLLTAARTEAHQTVISLLRMNSDTSDDTLREEIKLTARSVIDSLSVRPDSVGLFARWSTWLTRQLLSSHLPDLDSPRSPAFVDKSLMDALGEAIRGTSLPHASPSDAPAWEPWCYFCSLSLLANGGYIAAPRSGPFWQEWAVSPDEWASDRGRDLRGGSSLVVTLTKDTPGLGGHLLAFPIVDAGCAEDKWLETWAATQALREVVEFGDSDAGSDDYSRRMEASGLLLLLVRVGVAILDQGSSSSVVTGSSSASSLAAHHAVMAEAVREMVEIDDTLNRSQWETMMLHLVTRRAIWEQHDDEAPRPGIVFTHQDRPTLSEYLDRAKRNPSELAHLLFSIIQNAEDAEVLHRTLRKGAIDVMDMAAQLRRLHALSPRHYPLDESRLRQVIELVAP